MEKININELLSAVNGELIVDRGKYNIDCVLTDTRKLKENCMYIGIVGQNFNGNDFVEDASSKGAIICMVDEVKFKEENLSENTSIILVKDTKRAIIEFSRYYRSLLRTKIVGITGSTGKTTTKDIIYNVLKSKYNVFKTIGNLNNEIGLPLMIFSLDNSYDIAVLEMGMNNLNEIHNLAYASSPDIGIITNIGITHIENLKSRENIFKAKMEITDYFNKNNILIINKDDEYLRTINNKDYSIVTVSTSKSADIFSKSAVENESGVEFTANYEGEDRVFTIPLHGLHNVSNCLFALACGKIFDISYNEIKNNLLNIEITRMRLDIKQNKDYTIIDDTYNASPESMVAALNVLKKVNGKRKIAVLGTMRELGSLTEKSHEEIGKFASDVGIDKLIVTGDYSKYYKDGFNNNDNCLCFSSKEEIKLFLKDFLRKDDVVLIKASRSIEFEEIVKYLVEN